MSEALVLRHERAAVTWAIMKRVQADLLGQNAGKLAQVGIDQAVDPALTRSTRAT
jgi:hypothetical protein